MNDTYSFEVETTLLHARINAIDLQTKLWLLGYSADAMAVAEIIAKLDDAHAVQRAMELAPTTEKEGA